MNQIPTPDTFHRTAKAMVDSGAAATVDAAMTLLDGLRLVISIDEHQAHSPTRQALLLTLVTCARRCFLGGVLVTGVDGVALAVPQPGCRDLPAAIHHWGGITERHQQIAGWTPTVHIAICGDGGAWSCPTLRTTFQGWTGAVLGLQNSERLPETQENTLTGVYVGGLAVAEAFQVATGMNVRAGRRDQGASLWDTCSARPWRDADPGPVLAYLPARMWVIGLGHLGQAYLWALGMLPYASPAEVFLTLHDFDRVAVANDSTSPLTRPEMIGTYKTRSLACWCEDRGFQTQLIEMPFSEHFRVQGDQPRLALAGVDNRRARACLEQVGFDFIVEAGLGKGWSDFLSLQVHTFPSEQSAAEKWEAREVGIQAPALAAPGYHNLSQAGVDDCGLLQLATRSVGAAFVGCTTAALVIAEVVRVLHGGARHALIDASLKDLSSQSSVLTGHAAAPRISFTAAQ